MRRGRIFFYLAFILILGLVAVAVIWFRFLQPSQSPITGEAEPTPVVDLVDVVVVAQSVPRGDVLDETVLGTIPIQRDLVLEGYFTDMASVVGRRARVDLEPNMLLTRGMVVDRSEDLSEIGSIAALSIPRGMVAVSVPISRLSSVSYAPQAGDHVNVIVTMLMVDMDSDFQTVLPNRSAAVIGAGPGILIGSGTTEETQATTLGIQQSGSTAAEQSQAVLEGTGEIPPSKLTAQNVSGGPSSVIGKTITDPVLEQTYHAVPSEGQRPRMVSQNLLQDAVVLGVGNFPVAGQEDLQTQQEVVQQTTDVTQAEGDQGQTVQVTAPKLPDVITLIVTPQDAVTLNYLMFSGAELTLALRSANDDSRVQTEAATLDFLLTEYNIPVPAKLNYGVQPRVDELTQPVLTNDVQPTPQP